jgi:hypothetical protein
MPQVSALTMITIATGARRIQRSRPFSRVKPTAASSSSG